MVALLAETFTLRWASQADVIVDYTKRKVTFENTRSVFRDFAKIYLKAATIGLFALAIMWLSDPTFTPLLLYLGFVAFAPLVFIANDLLSLIPWYREHRYSKRTKKPFRTHTLEDPSHILLNGVRSLLDIEYQGECAETVTKAELRKAKRRWSLEIFFSKPSHGTVTVKEY